MSFKPFGLKCDECSYLDIDGNCMKETTCPRCGKGTMKETDPKLPLD